MDTKIYTPVATKKINNEVNIQKLSDVDVGKYLAYFYQEYGDIYELNNLPNNQESNDQKSNDQKSNNQKSNNQKSNTNDTPHQILPETYTSGHVNTLSACQQSPCAFSHFCIYFLYITATSIISSGLAYLAAFFLSNGGFRILIAIALFILIETVFLAGIPLVKKIKSMFATDATKPIIVYDI